MAGLDILLSKTDLLFQVEPPTLMSYPQSLYSPTRAFRLCAQEDNNFVLQYVDPNSLPKGWQNGSVEPSQVKWIPYWATKTAWNQVGDAGPSDAIPGAKTSTTLVMQADGNLVVYDANKAQGFVPGGAVFATGTNGNPGAFLRLQDDGNLVVYPKSGSALWPSGTSVSETPAASNQGL